MTIKFTVDERGHRRFTHNWMTFRAFWSPFTRRWTVLRTDSVTGANHVDDRTWHFKNWPTLEWEAETGRFSVVAPPGPPPN